MVEAVAPAAPIQVLRGLRERGFRFTVETRTEIHEHKVGAHPVTYADGLTISGPEPLTDEDRAALLADKPIFLAAACVMRPPVPWLRVLVDRYRTGYEIEVRRSGWKGPYRIRLAMVAANVAAFIGLHPAHDGPRLEPIIEEVLR